MTKCIKEYLKYFHGEAFLRVNWAVEVLYAITAIFRDYSAAKVKIGVDMRTSLSSTLLTRQRA